MRKRQAKKSGGSENSAPQHLTLWLGTDEAWERFSAAQEEIFAKELSGEVPSKELCSSCGVSDDEEEKQSRLLEISDGVGVITISGSLTNKDSIWNRFMGMTSYNEIRDALVQASSDESVQEIILDINSGGGAASGVSDIASLISMINNIKPVTTFTDGTMASAAYWLGSSAGHIAASDVAVVGSIGVIMKHVEYSKAMQKEGVTATLLRAGKFKALFNPYEPLTDVALAEADKQLQYTYGIFVQAIADNLGRPYPEVDSSMAQGREFVGRQALDIGLVDEVTTFDNLLAAIQQKIVDNSSHSSDNSFNNRYSQENGMRKQLNKAQYAAAIAAGADASTLELVADSPEFSPMAESDYEALKLKAEAGDEEAIAALKVEDEGRALANEASDEAKGEGSGSADLSAESDEGEGSIDADADAGAGADTDADAGDSAIVAHLESEAAKHMETIVDLKLEIKELEKELDSSRAVMPSFEEVVRTSMKQMQVALGGTEVDLSDLSGKALLAAHESTVEKFASTFSCKSVAATDAQAIDEGSHKVHYSARERAAVAAASRRSK